jgi:hypothetical protein
MHVRPSALCCCLLLFLFAPAVAAQDHGGLCRPITAEWGPDGALYVVDFGLFEFSQSGMNARPDTGVIWKVVRSGAVERTPMPVRKDG